MNKLPYVWELDKDGVISYAIGTIHVALNEYEDDVTEKLRGKKRLLPEINHHEMSKYHHEFIHALFKPFAPEEKNMIVEMLGISLDELRALPPGLFHSYLYDPAAPEEFPSVDYVLRTKAEQNNLEIISLETPQEKLQNLHARNFLEKILAPARKNPDLFGCLPLFLRQSMSREMERYQRGELRPVHSDLARNRRMAERSLSYLDQPSVVGIGASHFLAEPSLLSLYQEKGIKVKRIQ